jgi:hypothetical protein
MKICHQSIISFILLAFLSGCRGDEPKRMPDSMPDVYGIVTGITANKEEHTTISVMVKTIEGVESKFPDANITIDDNTLIEDFKGKRLKAGQIREGQQIQAWFEGDVMESMPAQGYVKAVRLKSE